jgi:hypothetical protein
MAFYMLFFCFVWSVFHVNGHIIHVHCQPFLGDVVGGYGIHHGLEGCWGVGESKEHYGWFKEAFIGDERCFPFISLFDPYVVVTPMYVEFGVERASV